MMEINKILPQFVDGKLNETRREIVQFLARTKPGKGLLPPREEAEKFLKFFEESNEQVRKKWFPEKKDLFKVDFNKYPEKTEALTLNVKIVNSLPIYGNQLSNFLKGLAGFQNLPGLCSPWHTICISYEVAVQYLLNINLGGSR